MGRVLVVLLVVAAGVSAAPPPKESAENRLRRLFGTPFDPEKDCSITLDGSQLRIKVPGTPHRFTPGYDDNSNKSLAPRVRRELAGDFDVRVQVLSVTPPGQKSDLGGMTAGGLFVGTEDDKFVTMSRYTTKADDGDGVNPQFLFQHYLPNGSGSGLGVQPNDLKDKPVYVRLVRQKNKITGYSSADGKLWTLRGSVDDAGWTWPDKVHVGVFTSHGVNHTVEGVFEDFQVIQPAGK
jgi:hypothetical protein